MRKYKSKNNKKILLSNLNNPVNEEKGESENFEKALEKLEADEEARMQNKNPFGKEENESNINNNNKDNNKGQGEKGNENANDCSNINKEEENKGDSNFDTTEDDDFLILKSVAKLKHELSEKEKICEDLHGWDEDF